MGAGAKQRARDSDLYEKCCSDTSACVPKAQRKLEVTANLFAKPSVFIVVKKGREVLTVHSDTYILC